MGAGVVHQLGAFNPDWFRLTTIVDIHQVTRLFSPQTLSVCSPFIFCALVGPGTAHVPDDRLHNMETQSACLYAETIRLVLFNVARHWSIGQILLGLYSTMSSP